MKKFLMALTAVSLMFTGCSGDDDASPVNNNDNDFVSTIQIENEPFTPSGGANAAITSYIENSETTMRSFLMTKQTTNIQTLETLSVSIVYPSGQASINGTYTFDFFNSDDSHAMGMYMKGQGSESLSFEDGTITVTDMGNNKYKLQFNNAKMEDFDETETRTVTGYFEGTFMVQ